MIDQFADEEWAFATFLEGFSSRLDGTHKFCLETESRVARTFDDIATATDDERGAARPLSVAGPGQGVHRRGRQRTHARRTSTRGRGGCRYRLVWSTSRTPRRSSSDWLLVTPYQACGTMPGCVPDKAGAQNGVVALAGADGRVLWNTPLDPRLRVDYIAAGEDVAVSLLRPPDAPDETLTGSRVVATEAADGTTRWESAGLWPVAVAGESTVVALDAATGTRKWDLADRYARSNVYLTLRGTAVVGTADEDGTNQRTRIIAADTGRELTDLGRARTVRQRRAEPHRVRRPRHHVAAMSDRYLVTFPHRSGELAVYRLGR